jgi:hypothetical protein
MEHNFTVDGGEGFRMLGMYQSHIPLPRMSNTFVC